MYNNQKKCRPYIKPELKVHNIDNSICLVMTTYDVGNGNGNIGGNGSGNVGGSSDKNGIGPGGVKDASSFNNSDFDYSPFY